MPPSSTRQLPQPPEMAAEAVEVARIWVTEGGGMDVSLRDNVFGEDYATWGIALVDIARHVAMACEQRTGIDAQTTFERIMEGFDAEREAPADDPEGEISDEDEVDR